MVMMVILLHHIFILHINIGSQMNFHSIQRIMKRLVCFISPSLWQGDIKHASSFIIHRIEICRRTTLRPGYVDFTR